MHSLRLCLLPLILLASLTVHAATVPDEILRQFERGEEPRVIIEYAADTADKEISKRALRSGRHETTATLSLRQQRYTALKQAVRSPLPVARTRQLADYSQLPMESRSFERLDDLRRWADDLSGLLYLLQKRPEQSGRFFIPATAR